MMVLGTHQENIQNQFGNQDQRLQRDISGNNLQKTNLKYQDYQRNQERQNKFFDKTPP